MIRPRDKAVLRGTGAPKTLCLLMESCGIGDDICTLPVLWNLIQQGYKITIYTRTFHKDIFRYLDCAIIGIEKKIECENGEYLLPDWDEKNLPKYERIIKLNNWGGWEDDEQGFSSRSRMEQFAEILETELPKEFSFKDILRPEELNAPGYIVLGTESVESWRSLPYEKASLLYDSLSKDNNVVWLTQGLKHYPRRDEMKSCSTFRELLNIIYNASHIYGVDNGVSHLAACLGKSLTSYFGMTEPNFILGQYSRYNNFNFDFIQGVSKECNAPCYRNPERGFVGQCCGKFSTAKCMDSIQI